MGFGDFFRTFEVSGARVSLASFGERVDFAEQGDDSTEAGFIRRGPTAESEITMASATFAIPKPWNETLIPAPFVTVQYLVKRLCSCRTN